MARPPSLVLKREDYEDVPGDWIDKLIRNLNLFTKQTTACLTRGVTFSENMAAFAITLDIPSDVSASKPVKFKNTLPAQQKPLGVIVVEAKNASGEPVSLGSPAWKMNSGTEVAIQGFNGQDGKVNVTLLVLGG
jgi:hypothetical protein